MKNNLFYIILSILTYTTISNGQEDLQIREKMKGKNTFSEVMKAYDEYYNDPDTKLRLGESNINRKYKRLKRWEWFMSSRLGPNGEFVNISEKLVEATGLQQNRELRTESGERNMAMSTAGNWSLVGPFDTENGIGRVDRLAFHPSNANIVYAGAAGGGLWRTTNAGNSWTNLTPDIPCLGISGIAISPSNTNTIYILTGDGDSDSPNGGGLVEGFGYMRLSIGVLKSTNGGSTWHKTGEFTGADYSNLVGYKLTMNPSDPQMLFACTNQGVFRTTNGGNTWDLVENRGAFFNLKFKPGSSTICYTVSLDGGVSRFFKSIDGGLTFTDNPTINAQISNPASRSDLAVAPSNSNVVYILAGGGSATPGFFAGIFRSSNSGDSFVRQSNSPNILGRTNTGNDNGNQSWYDLTMSVSNTGSNTVVVGAVFPWQSPDGGSDWFFRGNLHGDIHELGYHPVDNKLWAATDGGVYSSTDHGVNWTAHFAGMSISQFYRMAVKPGNSTEMIAGAQDNGVKKRLNGTSYFEEINNNSDGFTVGYDGADASVYYAIINTGIVRYTNDGANATAITPQGSVNAFASSMALHPSLANTVYFASNSFWRTSNATNINSWIVNPNVQGGWALRTCPSNANRIYIAGGANFSAANGILRRSDDAGVSWVMQDTLSKKPGFPGTFPKITYINVNPVNSSRVWVTFGGFTQGVKVYYSSNAGGSWVNRSGNLPNLPVNCIAIDNNSNAYIGTDNGIYYRAFDMEDWVPFYNNLPYVPVTDLMISQAENKIRAATFGRGIWESDLYSTCENNLNIAGSQSGQKFYEAAQNITSTASLLQSDGTKIQMRGGNQVLLQAGFTASETTQFRAVIGPCGSSGVAGFRISANDSHTKMPPEQYLPPTNEKISLIHVKSITHNNINFEINQKQEGKVSVILTDESGVIIHRKNFEVMEKGQWSESLSCNRLVDGNYYIYVLNDDTVQHMQEVFLTRLDTSKVDSHTYINNE